MRNRAFTVVELIVVIGILAVLASILFPAAAAAKNASYYSVCTSNLRQLGMAMELYETDNGAYPVPWASTFPDYIGHAELTCPMVKGLSNFEAYHNQATFVFKTTDPILQEDFTALGKCFEQRGPDYPLIVDPHHLPPIMHWDDELQGFALVFRVSGSVARVSKKTVIHVVLAQTGLMPAAGLPCSPAAKFGNL